MCKSRSPVHASFNTTHGPRGINPSAICQGLTPVLQCSISRKAQSTKHVVKTDHALSHSGLIVSNYVLEVSSVSKSADVENLRTAVDR